MRGAWPHTGTMIELSDWRGELAGRRGDEALITATAPLRKAQPPAGTKPVLVLADDGQRYWLKAINNPQRPNIPAVEQIVGRCGALIGAPVASVALVTIPEELAGYPLYPGVALEAGIAHGSLDVVSAQSIWSLDHVERDDNRSRYSGLIALYDWCWGGDPQWLYQTGTKPNQTETFDYEYYSHDHGEYLLSREEWSLDTILPKVDEPHLLPRYPAPSMLLDSSGLAERITAVTHGQLVEVLSAIPSSWPVSDAQLELIGFFLERRRDAVAARVQRRYLA